VENATYCAVSILDSLLVQVTTRL